MRACAVPGTVVAARTAVSPRRPTNPISDSLLHGWKTIERRNTFLPVFLDIWTLVFGQSAKSRGPLLFFLGSVLLWAYPMYFLRCVPVTWHLLPALHYIFIIVNLVMWLSILIANKKDPGTVDTIAPKLPDCDERLSRIPASEHG